jgi:hypothetical protein
MATPQARCTADFQFDMSRSVLQCSACCRIDFVQITGQNAEKILAATI